MLAHPGGPFIPPFLCLSGICPVMSPDPDIKDLHHFTKKIDILYKESQSHETLNSEL
jgi:hypothetical protein